MSAETKACDNCSEPTGTGSMIVRIGNRIVAAFCHTCSSSDRAQINLVKKDGELKFDAYLAGMNNFGK